MNADPDLGPQRCQCCHETPASACIDPHLGPVCVECYVELVTVRGAIEHIELYTGIGPCAQKSLPPSSFRLPPSPK